MIIISSSLGFIYNLMFTSSEKAHFDHAGTSLDNVMICYFPLSQSLLCNTCVSEKELASCLG